MALGSGFEVTAVEGASIDDGEKKTGNQPGSVELGSI